MGIVQAGKGGIQLVIVTPSNILRYNQAYKVPVQSSNATKEFSHVIESLSYEASQCSSRSQVDSKSSKEQAQVYY